MKQRRTLTKLIPAMAAGALLLGGQLAADPVVSTSLVDPAVGTSGVMVGETFEVLVSVTTNTTSEVPAISVLEMQYDSSKLELLSPGAQIVGTGDIGDALVGNQVTISGDLVAQWVVLFGDLSSGNTNLTPDLVVLEFEVVGTGGPYSVSVEAPSAANDPQGNNTQTNLLNNLLTAPISSAVTDSSATQRIPESFPTSVNDWMIMDL